MKNNRLSYDRGSHSKRKNTKTPGGRLVSILLKKKIKKKRCPVNGKILNGIDSKTVGKTGKTHISRHSSGDLSASALKDKIIKSFLKEEKKLAKKIFSKRGKLV